MNVSSEKGEEDYELDKMDEEEEKIYKIQQY